MAFSIISTTATGLSNTFPINFTLGFNNRNEVTCQVNNEVDGLGAPVYRSLSWVNDGLVNVLPATLIPAGQPVVFKRTILKTALIHDYSNGEAIEESNLDESNKQNLMAIHELFDGRFTSPFQQDLDMGTYSIKNLKDGINPQDAVTFQQLNNISGGAGNGLYLDVTGVQAADDLLMWNTGSTKFIRRSLAYLKNSVASAFGQTLMAVANAAAGRSALGAAASGANTDITSLASTTTVTTQPIGDSSTKIASTAFVAGSLSNSTQDFRLTLTSNTPVTSTGVTGATTIYCTPYKGNRISLHDGAKWNIRTSAQMSLALGTLVASRPYDVFCYDNAGTPTLELLAWTNTTTRATALVQQDGVLVKSGDSTRRYLGTFYTTSTTTTEDSVANRFLWNYYNRVARGMLRREPAVSWTYSSNVAWRQANANTANQLNFIVGVAEDVVSAVYTAQAFNGDATNRIMQAAIGLNSTTGIGSSVANSAQNNSTYMGGSGLCASIATLPAVGLNYLAMLELGAGTGTQTWYGAGSYSALGITGNIPA